MTADVPADDSLLDPGSSGLRSWQEAIGRRLTRSATIALLLSPAGLLIISVSRLLIVSNYSPATALSIASSGGYADTLLGTVIPLIPIFLPYLVLVSLFFNRVILSILAIAATALVSPVTGGKGAARAIIDRDWNSVAHAPAAIKAVLIILALLAVLLLFAEFIALGFTVVTRTLATIACIAAIPLVPQIYSFPSTPHYFTELMRQPWLPAETITLTSGQSFTGYVLADDGDWLIALRNDNRSVHYYPGSRVARLQVCQLSPAQAKEPLITFSPAQGSAPAPAPACAPPLTAAPPPVVQASSKEPGR